MKTKKEILKTKIEEHFPEIKIKTIKMVSTGWCNDVIILNNKHVFRFPKDKEAERIFKNEIKMLDFISKYVNVNIPDYSYKTKKSLFAGYDIITGRELTKDFINGLKAKEREKLTEDLAGFITVMHSFKKSQVEKFKIEKENGKKLCRETASIVKKGVFPLLKERDKRQIERFIPEMIESMNSKYEPKFTHNDLRGNHMFYDKKTQRLGIIDFGDCAFFDPAKDFSELIALGNDFVYEVFEKYKGEKNTDIMKRAFILYKRLSLVLMYETLLGYPMTFNEAYSMFKERFS